MKRVLFIEDDKDYANIICKLLTEEQYDVTWIQKSADVFTQVEKNKYDLALIDLHIDSLNGLQVTELLKREDSDISVIILTGSVSDEDEVMALENGVDEYLRKSISFAVMLQRIERILEFKQFKPKNDIILSSKAEKIEINQEERTVRKKGKECHLTFLEYDLLVYFLKNKSKVLTRVDILINVWKVEENISAVDPRTIDTYVKNLRLKLNIKSIYSVRAVGYRWNE